MTHARGQFSSICSTPAEQKTSSVKTSFRIVAVCIFTSICLLAAMLPLATAHHTAYADTESDLAAAKDRYSDVEAQLDALIAECADLSAQQAETQAKIDATQENIIATEEMMAQKELELQKHQEQLSAFAVQNYKADNIGLIEVLVASSSFKDFVSSLYYVEKISAQKTALIEQGRQIKQELSDQKKQLEADAAELEKLSAELDEQIENLRAKQSETQELLSSVDSEVQQLTTQYNEELAARAAAEAAARAAWSSGSAYAEEGYDAPSLVVTGNGSLSDVIAACYSTGCPGANLCAAWVTYVFNNAGVGSFSGNANDMYANWCYSSDLSELQPGMIVAVGTNPKGGYAGMVYGHVGIYVGGGIVMENIGYIAQTPISDWVSWYDCSPRWGWLGGVVLS